MNKYIFIFAILMGGCSSAPVEQSGGPTPEWVKAPTRTVDNGYIVYVGGGEDSAKDRASFKAESAAFQDLANECTFVPKGARLEDRFDKAEGGLHESYAKVAVEFQFCEEAKKTTDPEGLRKLANAAMTDQIKRYQDLMGQPQNLADLGSDEHYEDVPRVIGTSTVAAAPEPIASDFRFFVVRQQIAYAKQTVILSPANAYQPQSPETLGYMRSLSVPSQQVNAYAANHPEVQKTPQGWSDHQKHARELIRQRDPHYKSPFKGVPKAQNGDKKNPNQKKNGRHRRKKNSEGTAQ